MSKVRAPRIETDFNGFFEADLLCLAHEQRPPDHNGNPVDLAPGQYVIAYSEDIGDDGSPEFIVASGIVELSPSSPPHRGSIWSLRVDSRGVRYLSLLSEAD